MHSGLAKSNFCMKLLKGPFPRPIVQAIIYSSVKQLLVKGFTRDISGVKHSLCRWAHAAHKKAALLREQCVTFN